MQTGRTEARSNVPTHLWSVCFVPTAPAMQATAIGATSNQLKDRQSFWLGLSFVMHFKLADAQIP